MGPARYTRPARPFEPEYARKVDVEQPEHAARIDFTRQDAEPAEQTVSQQAGGKTECPFRFMFNEYPAVAPFGEQQGRIIRIEPKDIEKMPIQLWEYANNSFLLHGYYGYRHLILQENPDGTYYIGVPGIYHPREEFMARMFGFSNFVPISNNQREGFGYWMRKIFPW